MRPRCEEIANNILPFLRAMIAKELVERYDYSQISAAEKLGTTQPAISQYIYSKRGVKKRTAYDTRILEQTAKSIADSIISAGLTSDEINLEICKLCKSGKISPTRICPI